MDKKKDLETYTEFLMKSKGEIISRVSGAEMQMSLSMSRKIAKGKDVDVLMYLFNKARMDDKILAFTNLFEKDSKISKLIYPEMMSELRTVNRRRNSLAHSFPKPNAVKNFNTVKAFYFYCSNELGKTDFSYTFNDFKQDRERLDRITLALFEISKLID